MPTLTPSPVEELIDPDTFITITELSQLVGIAKTTLFEQISDGRFGADLRCQTIDGMRQYQLKDVLEWMNRQGLEPQVDPSTIGRKRAVAPPGDRLLRVDQVIRMLGIRRSWFYESLKNGLLPKADFCRPSPHPSYWLESSVKAWLREQQNRPDSPVLSRSLRRRRHRKLEKT